MPEIGGLFPTPRAVKPFEGEFSLPDEQLIQLTCPDPQTIHFAAKRLKQFLVEHTHRHWEIVAGAHSPAEQVGVQIVVNPDGFPHPQGYLLRVYRERVELRASGPSGAFYGVLTLCQLIRTYKGKIPCLEIRDWPDFPHRGVMLDISRDKVPTRQTLFDLIDLLASWKINQFQLYTEHTFAYQNHPVVWADASPMTGADILALDAYCRERFVELVPNQNSFGHMHRWLIHDRYRPLAECPEGCETFLGFFDEPFSLCPIDPGSLDLLQNLYDELLPHFSSRQFNVGLDETFDLGVGRSQQEVAKIGAGRVYLDFLQKIYRVVKARGYTMQFWGDILMNHSDLIPQLPTDVIALEWGYEAEHAFDEHGALYASAGVPFYVCPGTSSWNSLAGRTDNSLANLQNAAVNGRKHGAVGYLITDWGDNGHWQPLPVSYLGYAYGAAVSWGLDANRDLNLSQALNQHAFFDTAGEMGQLAFDLGNLYQEPGALLPNASVLFRILQSPPELIPEYVDLKAAGLHRTLDRLAQIVSIRTTSQFSQPEGHLLQREYKWVADMMRHACHRGLWALGENKFPKTLTPGALAQDADHLIEEFGDLWSARNRPGGFQDSRARMAEMRASYLSVG